jgi:hypothetical protein
MTRLYVCVSGTRCDAEHMYFEEIFALKPILGPRQEGEDCEKGHHARISEPGGDVRLISDMRHDR